MTKKFIFSLAAATMLMATSCSEDNLGGNFKPEGSEATVNLSVELPGTIQGRNYSDGTTAKELQYALYELNEADQSISALINTFTEEINLKKNISLKLVTGKTYGIVFWAQAPNNNCYTVDFDQNGAKMSVAMGNISNNNEALDAFYTYKVINVTGDTQVSAQLKRPFAQINIGTNDIEEAAALGFKAQSSQLFVWGDAAYDTLDLMTGEVSASVDDVQYWNFAPTSISTTEEFPVKGKDLEYLSMTYVLVGENPELVDIRHLIVIDEETGKSREIEITNVPVRRNYRTNIYGQVLTSNVDLVVEIVPDFETPDYEYDVDKVVADGVMQGDSEKEFIIIAPAGFEWLKQQGEGKDNNYGLQGYTFKLGNDIDMKGVDYVPFQLEGATFDGQDYTISNLTIDRTADGLTGSDLYAAFISRGIGTIKNIKFENVDVKGHWMAAVVAADAMCSHISNVHVKNAKVVSTPHLVNGVYNDANSVGIIAGYLSAQSNASITDSSVETAEVSAFRSVGPVAGRTQGTCVVTGNTVKDVKVIADMLQTGYENYERRQPFAGEIVGENIGNATDISQNTATNVTISVLRKTDAGFEVGALEDLKKIADLGASAYQGQTITFPKDAVIDMAGEEVSPIRFWSPERTVTVDFNGTTLKNVKLQDNGTGTAEANYQGLFGSFTGTIKNLNIDGLEASGYSRFTGIVSNLYGTMENVHVKNVNINNRDGRIGALVGIHNSGKIIDCSVEDAVLTGAWSVGGFVGASNETKGIQYERCTAKNVKITNTKGYGGVYDFMAGAITGNINVSGVGFEDCKVENCTVNGEDTELPIWHSFNDYEWNGVTITADIDNKGNFL